MSKSTVFETQIVLPDSYLTQQADRLLGFEPRYQRIHKQLQLMLSAGARSTTVKSSRW